MRDHYQPIFCWFQCCSQSLYCSLLLMLLLLPLLLIGPVVAVAMQCDGRVDKIQTALTVWRPINNRILSSIVHYLFCKIMSCQLKQKSCSVACLMKIELDLSLIDHVPNISTVLTFASIMLCRSIGLDHRPQIRERHLVSRRLRVGARRSAFLSIRARNADVCRPSVSHVRIINILMYDDLS